MREPFAKSSWVVVVMVMVCGAAWMEEVGGVVVGWDSR